MYLSPEVIVFNTARPMMASQGVETDVCVWAKLGFIKQMSGHLRSYTWYSAEGTGTFREEEGYPCGCHVPGKSSSTRPPRLSDG